MTYELHVAGLTRQLKLHSIGENLMIAGFVVFGDVELTVACARELLRRAPEYDYMIAPEAKAIPLIHEMARQSGRNEYLLARKAAKAYMDGVFSVKYTSITTQGSQELFMDGSDAKKMAGKRVLNRGEPGRHGAPGQGGRRHHCGQDGGAGRGRRRRPEGHHLSGKAPPL